MKVSVKPKCQLVDGMGMTHNEQGFAFVLVFRDSSDQPMHKSRLKI